MSTPDYVTLRRYVTGNRNRALSSLFFGDRLAHTLEASL